MSRGSSPAAGYPKAAGTLVRGETVLQAAS
jgi:hypothetical protein